MEIREFAFDLVNNRLKFNASKAKFLENFSASCSFCVKSLVLPAPKEILKHFFLHCTISGKFFLEYFTDFLQNKPIPFKHYFSLIRASPELTYNNGLILNSEIILVNFFLVKCKKRRQLPIL